MFKENLEKNLNQIFFVSNRIKVRNNLNLFNLHSSLEIGWKVKLLIQFLRLV